MVKGCLVQEKTKFSADLDTLQDQLCAPVLMSSVLNPLKFLRAFGSDAKNIAFLTVQLLGNISPTKLLSRDSTMINTYNLRQF